MNSPIPESIINTAVAHGIPCAVRRHKVSYSQVYNEFNRRGLDAPKQKTVADARLAAAHRHATPGLPWTREMVACAMGVSTAYVGKVEREALLKIRRALSDEDREALAAYL